MPRLSYMRCLVSKLCSNLATSPSTSTHYGIQSSHRSWSSLVLTSCPLRPSKTWLMNLLKETNLLGKLPKKSWKSQRSFTWCVQAQRTRASSDKLPCRQWLCCSKTARLFRSGSTFWSVKMANKSTARALVFSCAFFTTIAWPCSKQSQNSWCFRVSSSCARHFSVWHLTQGCYQACLRNLPRLSSANW